MGSNTHFTKPVREKDLKRNIHALGNGNKVRLLGLCGAFCIHVDVLDNTTTLINPDAN
jgi:hypothetical protein